MSRVKTAINQSPTNYTPSTADSIESHLAAIDTALGNVTGVEAVGQIVNVPHDNIPNHVLKCDGSAVSRTTYATLYNAIGVIYGNGDGSTTFNLPDYRGYFLRGYAYGSDPDTTSRTDRGDGTTGAAVGTVQGYGFYTHTHTVQRNTNDTAGGGGAKITGSGTNDWTANNGGNESRPDNKYVWFCIVYEESSA